MEQRTYSGRIDPLALARHLLDSWDQGETVAQALESDGVLVQIGQRRGGLFGDEPRQALAVGIEPQADGVQVTMGQQRWHKEGGKVVIGGLIGIFPFFFTWPPPDIFGGEGEPIDQGLRARVWRTVEAYTGGQGAATGPTRRLESVSCPACGVANPAGAAYCSACGSSLRAVSCPRCGAAAPPNARFCIQCGASLADARAVGEAGG
ncbi:MAG TPA: zinc ribbon domain-containing protein [Chloroflexaceae bacterium]|nr:zinc ribbon domain-containing protein [Chloroflexaceae bacterium]